MNVTWWLIPSGLILILAVAILTVVARRRGYPHAPRRNNESSKSAHGLTRELVHEIRNPLNSVNLNLQILEEDLSAENPNSPGDLQNRVRRIRREVERLDRILTDFRRYANLPPLMFEAATLGCLSKKSWTSMSQRRKSRTFRSSVRFKRCPHSTRSIAVQTGIT